MASNLSHLTDSTACKLLADRTRRSDLDTADFSDAYRQLGWLLATSFVGRLPLEAYMIRHCQGEREGVRLSGEERVGILAVMRAGLYLAQGFRLLLRKSPLLLVDSVRGVGLESETIEKVKALKLTHAVIVDAVVNTGSSIEPTFAQLRSAGVGKIFVVAGVAPRSRAEDLAANHPHVEFLYARLSDNSYVGKGGTDTGNRLFGTEMLD